MPAQFPFGNSNATPLADYALGESYDVIHAVYLKLADISQVAHSSVAILEAAGLLIANVDNIAIAVSSVNDTKAYLDDLKDQVDIAEQNIMQISGGYTSLQAAIDLVQSGIATTQGFIDTATDLSNSAQQLYDDFVGSAGTLATKNSPVFTGSPQAPTPATVDNGTTVATTAFVKAAITAAQPDLSTLAPKSSPTFTGQPTAPTPVSGNNSTALATTQFVQAAIAGITPGTSTNSVCIPIACSDETTLLTAGAAKVSFRMPFGMTLTEVFACTNTSPTGTTLIVDILNNITSVFTTAKLTIDPGEDTSASAAVAPVIVNPTLGKNNKISISILAVGANHAGTGLKVFLTGTPS